ncbi:MAG: sporulation protein YtfJ [Clostridioides sp.]|jgi:sporulation protein YtfJ|nr:sporulation protein YtfJ [Clostridioides sp.]
METTLETIKGSIDANTIVGDPIHTEDTVIVPISKVTIGFGIGGGEYSRGSKARCKGRDRREEPRVEIGESERSEADRNDSNFGGGSCGAITVQPVAFVVVENGETRLMSADDNMNLVDNILTVTPKLIEKIQDISKKKEKKDREKEKRKRM